MKLLNILLVNAVDFNNLYQLYGNSIGGNIQQNTINRMKNIMEKNGDYNKIELANNKLIRISSLISFIQIIQLLSKIFLSFFIFI